MARTKQLNEEYNAENESVKRVTKKKMLPYVIEHCTKAGKIELQNLLFGTSEKKLLVSNEFLNSMTIKYVSRRMKTINTCFENISNTKVPSRFFRYSEEIESCLDELILIEPYYMFKHPIPSVYKKNYLLKKPELITRMLTRSWKFALQKHPIKDGIEDIDPKILAAYDVVINEMLSYKDQLSEDDLTLINEFYIQVHGEPEIVEDLSLVDTDDEDAMIDGDMQDDENESAEESVE